MTDSEPASLPRDTATTTERAREEVFLSRRPIFDPARRTKGCQLCSNVDSQGEDAQSVRLTLGAAVNAIGLDQIASPDELIFVRVVTETLTNEEYAILPAERTVLMMRPPRDADAGLLDACRLARNAGYMLSIDLGGDFTEQSALLAAANFVIVDFARSIATTPLRLPRQTAGVALNVESSDAFEKAVSSGFTLLQGFFYSAPTIIAGRTANGFSTTQQSLLRETTRTQIDSQRVERIVAGDPALTLKLLRHVNSAALGVRERITSVRHALLLLGERRVKRWGLLTALSSVATHKPHELLLASVVRSRFCEELATLLEKKELTEEMFLVGLLSAMDAIMDQPMNKVLDGLLLNDAVRAGLLHSSDSIASQVLDLARACERGAWETSRTLCAKLGVPQNRVVATYYHALGRSRQDFQQPA